MPPAPKQDPFQALADILAPAVTALVEQLRVAFLTKPTVDKIIEAFKRKEGVELSADEVKALLVVISGLSEKKR